MGSEPVVDGACVIAGCRSAAASAARVGCFAGSPGVCDVDCELTVVTVSAAGVRAIAGRAAWNCSRTALAGAGEVDAGGPAGPPAKAIEPSGTLTAMACGSHAPKLLRALVDLVPPRTAGFTWMPKRERNLAVPLPLDPPAVTLPAAS